MRVPDDLASEINRDLGDALILVVHKLPKLRAEILIQAQLIGRHNFDIKSTQRYCKQRKLLTSEKHKCKCP